MKENKEVHFTTETIQTISASSVQIEVAAFADIRFTLLTEEI